VPWDSDGVDFEEAVAAVLDSLRPGDVVTYGEVAAEAGRPGAARAVGAYLAKSGGRHPWWRVVTTTGRLVPGFEQEHARRLLAEGTEVRAGRVPMRG
jgi:methylated-DNA-protein-cysteine methyltransferase related protein